VIWAGDRQSESVQPSPSSVLDHLSDCSVEHRVVLMLAYVDGIPIAEIAEMLGSSVSTTYSLLARARHELRSHLTGDPT
jgi:DNA-directed RNA polymerase specialized sigma24 family protein